MQMKPLSVYLCSLFFTLLLGYFLLPLGYIWLEVALFLLIGIFCIWKGYRYIAYGIFSAILVALIGIVIFTYLLAKNWH